MIVVQFVYHCSRDDKEEKYMQFLLYQAIIVPK
jgi:hypothetical protein